MLAHCPLAEQGQACQQWALAQPGAEVDAGVQQRGLAACMDARGYTVR